MHLKKHTMQLLLFKIIILLLLFPQIQIAQELIIIKPKLSPFHYEYQDRLISSIIKKIIKTNKFDFRIKTFTFNKAFELTQQNKNLLICYLPFDKTYKNDFVWIGPILKIPVYFYKHKNSNVNISNFNEAKSIRYIGVSKNTKALHVLKRKNFSNLIVLPNAFDIYKGLQLERIDLILSDEHTLNSYNNIFNIDKNMDFVNTNIIAFYEEVYFAFSKNTPEKIIKLWENALKK